MVCSVCHTANAGVYVTIGSVRFLLDALPRHAVNGFAALTPQQAEELLDTVFPPDLLLVTHCHPDHYSDTFTAMAVDRFPEMEVIRPWKELSGTRLLRETYSVQWFPLRHAHQESAPQVQNYGYLIEAEGRRIFCPGDADPRFPEVFALVDGLRPDVAILNFPWVTLSSARKALNAMAPRCTVLTHLPPANNDPLGFHRAVEHAIQGLSNTVVLDRFMQTVTFDV